MLLIINSGSSSIKFRLYKEENLEAICEGITERIGLDGHFKMIYKSEKYSFDIAIPFHLDGVKIILNQLEAKKIINNRNDIKSVGFRVVHGGDMINKPVMINHEVKDIIRKMIILAPLHNPGVLVAIEAFEKQLSKTKMVACFDTSFHQTIPMLNFLYPLPYEIYKENGVRKYGFHGLSYNYITEKMADILKKPISDLNLIICHLGNGASVCVVKKGKSLDTTMGLTPLAGLMMGTRSGDIDPSIIEYLMKTLKKDISEITDLLNKKSGLIGLSQLSSDMRDIEEIMKTNPQAKLAFDKYCQIITNFVVQYANKLSGKIDAIVFTAGIGENSDLVRQKVIDEMPLLNLEIDQNKNVQNYSDYKLISTSKSRFPIYVVRTNEELLIAKQTKKI